MCYIKCLHLASIFIRKRARTHVSQYKLFSFAALALNNFKGDPFAHHKNHQIAFQTKRCEY